MPRFDRPSLYKRILSAAVLIPLTLFLIWSGGLFFALFCIAGALITFYEWRLITKKIDHSMLYMALGLIYIGVAGVCFYLLRETFSFKLSMMCLALVWISDSGAFFTGKLIGGPKLAEKISPNKTWAGFLGAILFPGILAMIFVSFYTMPENKDSFDFFMVYSFCFLVGALMGVIGQCGDLLVSYFKRQSGIKDTGNLIPGHGGLLDRIDSLLPNLPVFLSIALVIEYYVTL